jgi:hypothetical protein
VIAEESLTRTIEAYLAGSRHAIVLEDGAALFDLTRSKYSLSGEHGKCLLHLWSDERNTVRRVLEAEERKGMLQLTVPRMGQPRPSKLEICRNLDPRTTTARKAARAAYQHQLQRMLARSFPEFRLIHMTTGANLEQSFGPVYARGLLRRGQTAFAIFGVNAQEAQSSIDASLTFAILWLDLCRRTHATKLHVEGLKLFVPVGTSDLVRTRMAHLNQSAAKWRIFAVNEQEDSLAELDCRRPRQYRDPTGPLPRRSRRLRALRRLNRRSSGHPPRSRNRHPLRRRNRLPPPGPRIRPRPLGSGARFVPQS